MQAAEAPATAERRKAGETQLSSLGVGGKHGLSPIVLFGALAGLRGCFDVDGWWLLVGKADGQSVPIADVHQRLLTNPG